MIDYPVERIAALKKELPNLPDLELVNVQSQLRESLSDKNLTADDRAILIEGFKEVINEVSRRDSTVPVDPFYDPEVGDLIKSFAEEEDDELELKLHEASKTFYGASAFDLKTENVLEAKKIISAVQQTLAQREIDAEGDMHAQIEKGGHFDYSGAEIQKQINAEIAEKQRKQSLGVYE